MGREIKRVAMDFQWPLSETWSGYLNPHYVHRRDCPFCDGCGLNPATKKIEDDWYDSAQTGWRWCHNIGQVEIDALIEHCRLHDFTSDFVPGTGWVKKDPMPAITPEQVNAWSHRGFGHDSINHCICVEARAKSLGVYGKCPHCDGSGEVWRTPEDHAACEAWQPTEPPAGDGWQVWETTSEGGPISAVCKSPEALARWCVDNRVSSFGNDIASYESWLNFALAGWCPSMVVSDVGGVQSGVEFVGSSPKAGE